ATYTEEGLSGLDGAALEVAFTAQLSAHAHASMTVARAEMVAGAHPGARGIAQESIRAQCRSLTALAAVVPAQADGSPVDGSSPERPPGIRAPRPRRGR